MNAFQNIHIVVENNVWTTVTHIQYNAIQYIPNKNSVKKRVYTKATKKTAVAVS